MSEDKRTKDESQGAKDEGKMVIYQVFTRLFGNSRMGVHGGSLAENGCGKMADFTLKALAEIKKLGATHIWYTGIIEHATHTDYRRYGIPLDHPAIVKGKAGSPYAIKDYYNVDPDLAVDVPGRMREFENLVRRTHRAGLQVIIDFVPNHVARQYHSTSAPEGVRDLGQDDDTNLAFSPRNNFYYIPHTDLHGHFDMRGPSGEAYRELPAKATGNDRFDATPNVNDWYETVKLNYGVDYVGGRTCHFDPIPDTWTKMLHILLFWASKGIDGLRCDMAEMVPVEFWQWAIPQVKDKYPRLLFIAEVYNPNEYHNYLERGHFDYLYDKVGLYDTLRGVIASGSSATGITYAWQALGDLAPRMLNFLENHDEQRIASSFFAGNALKAIPGLIVSALMNTNPMMVYFGQEFGEPGMDNEGFSGRDGRTTIYDYWSLDTIRRWRNGGKFDGRLLTDSQKEVYAVYRRILGLCRQEKAISKGRFFDLMYANLRGWRFNEHRQFAFLRQEADELLLIVVNFGPYPAEVAVVIPRHAFDFLGIPALISIPATDLLTDTVQAISLLPDKAVDLSLPGYGGKILKVKWSR